MSKDRAGKFSKLPPSAPWGTSPKQQSQGS